MRPTPLAATAAAFVLALGAALAGVTTASASAPSASSAVVDPASPAQRALAVAEDALAGRAPTRDATLALRDLALQRDQLTGADRRAADRLLARPGATERRCTDRICVHWKPSQATQDYIDAVVKTVDDVHKRYKRAGYRSPKADGGRGGNNKTDIYIQNIGDQGLYGYCTSDQKRYNRGSHAIWAYCVLDNDYSSEEFPTNTPIENMQVTAAHEYFHAVQYAYDAAEDGWLIEATATWVEDEVFDGVDDNVNYLGASPLARPRVSLDKFGDGHQCGDWIFFRYLTEKFRGEKGGIPKLVLDIWKAADSVGRGKDRYSLQALSKVLADRKTSMREQFAAFNDANLRPAQTYEEGAANGYPATAPAGQATLSPSSPASGVASLKLDHLSAATARFVPSGTSGAWKLKVTLNMAGKDKGSAAIITINKLDGSRDTRKVNLAGDGDAKVKVPFSSDSVQSVDVTMVNTSTRMKGCGGAPTPFSCYGTGRDDNLVQKVSGKVIAG